MIDDEALEQFRRDHSLVGRRVRLEHISDPSTRLRPGAMGTVSLVGDVGTVHVAWDSGAHLGLIPGEDRFTLLDPNP